jgi:VanZ family protein
MLLLAILVPLGLLLVGFSLLAWGQPRVLQGWLTGLQTFYGVPRPVPDWLRVDHHLHLVVAAAITIWFDLLFRLFMPRAMPWAPVAMTVLIAIADELTQSFVSYRNFEMADEVAGALGIAVAFPVLLLLTRMTLAKVR